MWEKATSLMIDVYSIQKGTSRVLNCWLSRSDLPMVHIHIAADLYQHFLNLYGKRLEEAKNIQLHKGKLDTITFGKIIAEASFFLCPSIMEGYGHYINQARASGGLILTPNIPPMNELITPSSGVLIDASSSAASEQFLGGVGRQEHALRNVTGFIAQFDGTEVCEAVDKVLFHMTSEERKEKAERSKQQYFFDTVFFSQKMKELLFVGQTKHYLRQQNE